MERVPRDPLPGFHVLTKPVGPICNLDCRYCYYLEKQTLYPCNQGKTAWVMNDRVLEEFVRQYTAAQPNDVVSFVWQGGEPTLLGVDYFRKVVALQKKHAEGRRIENAIQTNAVLLDEEWCAFLAEHDFLVGVSIDGPEELNDEFRVDKAGRSTLAPVLRGLELLKAHGVKFNTLTVVHRQNSRLPLRVYRFLKEIGSGFVQFIPVVERLVKPPDGSKPALVAPGSDTPAPASSWSVQPAQYGKFLYSIFDEWVRQDVGRYYVQGFDVALESWLGLEPSLCVHRTHCGDAMALEHNGDLYSCDHFVFDEYRLGNLLGTPLATLAASPRQSKFGRAKRDTLPRYCRECDVLFACNGECPKNRFARTPDGEPGLNYLCAGYKMFFHHIAPYMEFMANELRHQRPPANVMSWIRQQDLTAAGSAGRNAPCPCGSGRKYKKCCGARPRK